MNVIKARTSSRLPRWYIILIVTIALKFLDSVGIVVTGFEPEDV